MSELTTKEYFIAYFDILGYKVFFEDNESDINELLKSIIGIARDTGEMAKAGISLSENMYYKMFSDNCIILIERIPAVETEQLEFMSKMVASLQLKFLKDYNILIRGCITLGNAYIDEQIVFGKGLVRAVELESKVAIYPRIIIDFDTIQENMLNFDSLLYVLDNDEKYYLDFFSLLKVSNVYFPEKNIKRDICTIRDKIYKLIVKYGHYGNYKDLEKVTAQERIILKYIWLLVKYNDYVEEEKLPTNIQYNVAINKRVNRFEIGDVRKNPWPIFAD